MTKEELKLEEYEFNDFLTTMRLVQKFHGKSSKAIRHAANELLKRYKTEKQRLVCKNLSTCLFAYDVYIALEKRIERYNHE